MYATVQEAEVYFGTRLHSSTWFSYSSTDRTAALVTATRHIDRLNFVGERAAAYAYRESLGVTCYTAAQEKAIAEAGLTQSYEFPRSTDTEYPNDIKIACMEIAFELINGKDPDLEFENLANISQGYSNVRNTQDRSFVHEHLNAGIVSAQAWRYLKPYLRDGRDFKINRVS